MPKETPEESTLRARRIGVAVIGVLVLAIGVLAGISVWSLLTGRGLSVSGWIYIICFVFAVLGFIPMVRQVRRPPTGS